MVLSVIKEYVSNKSKLKPNTMKSDSIIIIPTYNEKENIENIIRAVFGLEKYFHILIIEDNSPDDDSPRGR